MPCPICNDAHILYTGDETRVKQCICVYVKKLRKHLGSEIATADEIASSPLYKAQEYDLTTESLYIKSSRNALLPHLRYTLSGKGTTFAFNDTTDHRILNVWLGNESFKARSKDQQDTSRSYNDLYEFLGEDWDLVIIVLGQITHPNRAAANVLRQALTIRKQVGKPVWLVDCPDNPWNTTTSYNSDTAVWIDEQGWKEIVIDSAGKPDEAHFQSEGFNADTGDVDLETSPPEKERRPKRRVVREELEESGSEDPDAGGIDMPSGGGNTKKRYH